MRCLYFKFSLLYRQNKLHIAGRKVGLLYDMCSFANCSLFLEGLNDRRVSFGCFSRRQNCRLKDVSNVIVRLIRTRNAQRHANIFSARQHICYSALYAIARPSVRRPSVCHTGGSVKDG